MTFVLAFAPFLVFVVVERFIGVSGGLIFAAVVSAALLARDMIARKGGKILEWGIFVLFAGLALYSAIVHPTWSSIAVRLRVDTGLFLIVVISMLVRQPFTLQYARERVDIKLWGSPEFVRINYVLTGAWAFAFGVMVAAEAALLHKSRIQSRAVIIITVLALVAAIKFSGWYTEHQNRVS